ncbi:MAG: thioredoxin family protein [Candidatus Dojkabacteria bacterium]
MQNSKKSKIILIILLASFVLIIIGIIVFVSSYQKPLMIDEPQQTIMSEPVSAPTDNVMHEESMMKLESTSKPGEYIPYSVDKLTLKKNVIFFAAGWCPTCQALNKAINGDLKAIPNDLTILKADYDTETALKQKYGVTYQHTLVQVDNSGNLIKKWSGSYSIDEIVNQLI